MGKGVSPVLRVAGGLLGLSSSRVWRIVAQVRGNFGEPVPPHQQSSTDITPAPSPRRRPARPRRRPPRRGAAHGPRRTTTRRRSCGRRRRLMRPRGRRRHRKRLPDCGLAHRPEGQAAGRSGAGPKGLAADPRFAARSSFAGSSSYTTAQPFKGIIGGAHKGIIGN